jgi:hypothetical protein
MRLFRKAAGGRQLERGVDRIDLSRPWDLGLLRATYPGDSDDERHCREVIVWFGNSADGTTPTVTIEQRLKVELRELVQEGGLRPRQ